MKNEKMYLVTNLILIVSGFFILFFNNDISLALKDAYLSNKGFGDAIEIEIFKNYSHMFLIIGGVLFYNGVYRLTTEIFTEYKK